MHFIKIYSDIVQKESEDKQNYRFRSKKNAGVKPRPGKLVECGRGRIERQDILNENTVSFLLYFNSRTSLFKITHITKTVNNNII
jgi:hypothetical protein